MKTHLLPFILVCYHATAQLKYPVTEKQDVTDDYFGKKIADPYRWLEDDRSAKTGSWVTAQNEVTNNYLSQIAMRDRIKKRLAKIWGFGNETPPFRKGDSYFCFRNNGRQNQNVFYIKKSLEDTGTVLLDPNLLSGDGTVSISGISISKDGKYLAYGLSKAGSDWVTIYFMEIAGRKKLTDELKWVKFSGISWKGNGIYYSRYDQPAGSELSAKNEFHKVFYHAVGTGQADDQLIHEDKLHPEYNFGASVTSDERYLMLYTSKSTSGEMLAIRDLAKPDLPFVAVSGNFDSDFSVVDHLDGTFYVHTNHGAPNFRLVAFTLEGPSASQWKTIIPENEHVLEQVRLVNGGQVIAGYLENVTSKLYLFTKNGEKIRQIELPGLCRVGGMFADRQYDFSTFATTEFVSPARNWHLDANTGKLKLLFAPACEFKSSSYITEQVFYASKDGTKVPMFITRRKDVKPGPSTPCFVYGYGGFNISVPPEFRIDRTVFLEAGGIYCVPNLRGGGEFGKRWHTAGTKCQKQNVFDDFISACEFLVKNGYTSYDRIAIHGRSNGGLLVGAVMTQRPDICKVAIPTVGVLDMLRFHRFTIGRAWTVDYGSSENKEEFDCLLRYSPLHNLKETKYPATLVLTGDHDDRVVPAHSFKYAATLQEKQRGTEPVLIRIDVNAGHGAGKPIGKQIDEYADMWSFVFHNLQMPLN
jgi:prolyl oligopeptidase